MINMTVIFHKKILKSQPMCALCHTECYVIGKLSGTALTFPPLSLPLSRCVRHISGADVHGGAGRWSGRHPLAADLPGNAVQVLPDRAHALLQEPLWQ